MPEKFLLGHWVPLFARKVVAGLVPKSGLLMCLGNIHQSPIAGAVFRKLVTDQNVSSDWRIDSAAASTDEVGNPWSSRTELHEEAWCPQESHYSAGS